jgi:universal stress protein A
MQPFTSILTAIDFSDNSDHAFCYALMLARKFDAHLTVLHVINEPVDLRGFYVPHISFEQLEQEIEASAHAMMETFCREKLADFSNYSSILVTGIPCDEIVAKAREVDASLIVVGTHGRTGLDHIIFGSTAERVVRTAHCPVLTVHLPSVQTA